MQRRQQNALNHKVEKVLGENKIHVLQAPDDADKLIIDTAVPLPPNENVAVIGEDVDLWVLVIALARPERNIIFYCTNMGKKKEEGVRRL